MRTQLRLRRDDQFIADRNVVEQLRIDAVTDADVIATLLDRRVLLDLLYLALAIASKPIGNFDVGGDLHLTRAASAHVHAPRASAQVNVSRTGHGEGPLK